MSSPSKKTSFLKKFFEKGDDVLKAGVQPLPEPTDSIEDLPLEQQVAKLKAEISKLRNQLKVVDPIINYAPFPIWIRDENLSIKFCNNAYSEIIEMTPEMLLEDEFMELGSGVRRITKEALDTGETVSGKTHIVVGGERKLFKITEVPLIGDHQMIGFATDITEQEKAEELIKLHARAQADFLESSTSAMAVYGSDMRLMSYNHSFANLWSLEENWLDTKPSYSEVMERLRENRKLPEQANFQMFKKEHIKLFTNLLKPHEEFLYLPDGVVLRMLAIPHALGGLLFAYEDVTDRLALERSYNTLIAVQRATLDNLYEAVAVFGEDGRVKLCNPVYAKLWGLDMAFLLTQPHISDVVEKTSNLHLFEGSWDAYKEKIIANILRRESKLTVFERSDGKFLRVNFVPLPDGATLVTYVDITDSTLVERSLREKNSALEEADRIKSEFLANVSYELRSPLTSIKGFTEILKSNMFGEQPPKHVEYIDYIDQSSNQLTELINDILDVATIEAGFLKLEKTTFNVYDLITHLVYLINDKATKSNVRLVIDCNTEVGPLLADETRIKQAVLNLLSNSVKFTPEGGMVTIGAKRIKEGNKEKIVIWVDDTGLGIPEKEQAVVFQKFYKSGSTRAHKSGTGLGLTITKNIVELHKGEVKIESREGIGTKVSLIIPVN